jgi:hypothetical protein
MQEGKKSRRHAYEHYAVGQRKTFALEVKTKPDRCTHLGIGLDVNDTVIT